MSVKLIKEPDNENDKEAIRVEMDGLGLIGYVANSVHTVLGESYSAGRLYDRIGNTAGGTVKYVLVRGVCANYIIHRWYGIMTKTDRIPLYVNAMACRGIFFIIQNAVEV